MAAAAGRSRGAPQQSCHVSGRPNVRCITDSLTGSSAAAACVSQGIQDRTQAASSRPEPTFSARQHADVADDVYASVSHQRGSYEHAITPPTPGYGAKVDAGRVAAGASLARRPGARLHHRSNPRSLPGACRATRDGDVLRSTAAVPPPDPLAPRVRRRYACSARRCGAGMRRLGA